MSARRTTQKVPFRSLVIASVLAASVAFLNPDSPISDLAPEDLPRTSTSAPAQTRVLEAALVAVAGRPRPAVPAQLNHGSSSAAGGPPPDDAHLVAAQLAGLG